MKFSNLTSIIYTLLLLISVSLCSCESEIINVPEDEIDSLSAVLIDNIESFSKTGDISHYIIAEFDEYDLIPADPLNSITEAKVKLGMMLYHDPALGIHPVDQNNYQTYSCASCHPADCEFQPGISQGIGEGGSGYGNYGEGRIPDPNVAVADLDVQPLKTPSALNFAYAPNTLWDAKLGSGGFNEGTEELWVGFPMELNHYGYEGLETQVFAGLEVHRSGVYDGWVDEYNYTEYFDDAFPDFSEDVRYTDTCVALAIAAYERTMTTSRAPFQYFLRGDYTALSETQKKGGILFFGKAACASCHTSTSLGNSDALVCIGINDFDPVSNVRVTEQLGRGGFTKKAEDMYLFKVPQLYNLMGVGFYGHGSSMHSLRDMINYCAGGVPENENVPVTQISKRFVNQNLSKTELDYIEDFIRGALYDDEIKRHQPDRVMSGFCFPNADAQSKLDFGLN